MDPRDFFNALDALPDDLVRSAGGPPPRADLPVPIVQLPPDPAEARRHRWAVLAATLAAMLAVAVLGTAVLLPAHRRPGVGEDVSGTLSDLPVSQPIFGYPDSEPESLPQQQPDGSTADQPSAASVPSSPAVSAPEQTTDRPASTPGRNEDPATSVASLPDPLDQSAVIPAAPVPSGSKVEAPPADGIPLDEEHFPDPILRAFAATFDQNQDAALNEEEVQEITVLDRSMTFGAFSLSKVTSLQGIEYFSALETLRCQKCGLTRLDLSGNPQLKTLDCSQNDLAELDISQNTVLSFLNCSGNQLTQLNLTNNPELMVLNCSDNRLTDLDIHTLNRLIALDCSINSLSDLDFTASPSLKIILCSQNYLNELDISHNQDLVVLDCSRNRLTLLDTHENPSLYDLDCGNNFLIFLDLTENLHINNLVCEGNRLTDDSIRFSPLFTNDPSSVEKAEHETEERLNEYLKLLDALLLLES